MPPFQFLRVDLHYNNKVRCSSLPNWRHPSIYVSPPWFCAVLTAIPSHVFYRSEANTFQLSLENHHHTYTYRCSVYIDKFDKYLCQIYLRPLQGQIIMDVPINPKLWASQRGLIRVKWQRVIQLGIENVVIDKKKITKPRWSPMEKLPSVIFELNYCKEELHQDEWILAQEVMSALSERRYSSGASGQASSSGNNHNQKKSILLEILSSENENESSADEKITISTRVSSATTNSSILIVISSDDEEEDSVLKVENKDGETPTEEEITKEREKIEVK